MTDWRLSARDPGVIPGNPLLDPTSIAIGRAPAQHVLGPIVGSAESASGRRHRPDAQKSRIEFLIVERRNREHSGHARR